MQNTNKQANKQANKHLNSLKLESGNIVWRGTESIDINTTFPSFANTV